MAEPSKSSGSKTNSEQNPLSSINRDFEERSTAERAQKMGMSYVDIAKIPINPDHLSVITPEEARTALLIPFFKVGKKLRLAIVHPTQTSTQALIQKLKEQGYAINVNLASENGMFQALEAYRKLEPSRPIQAEQIIDEASIQSYQHEIENLAALKNQIQSVSAEEALEAIDMGAIKTGASDVHYQPEEKDVALRFRIDGVLQEVMRLDHSTYKYISNQLKYKAKMKLNVNNIPQDGRYVFLVNQRKVDVRVSSIPTEYSESFVCRYLDSNKKSLTFEQLGFEGRTLELIRRALTLSNGMILVTGPTGSGKTSTLYSLLTALNEPSKKIITLEDPIEYHLTGVTQSQINEKRSYTFASGLKAILRQDPDIVMIGEIRDEVTAQTCAQASLTGHLLLSTLHTNSALASIPRLANLDLKPFMIAPSLGLVIAQRLVRRICPYCAQQEKVSPEELEFIHSMMTKLAQYHPELQWQTPATLPKGRGCEKCSHTGFIGQIAISEAFENSDELKSQILSNAGPQELLETARKNGMITLLEDGVFKVLRGVTTLSEVERVTNWIQ